MNNKYTGRQIAIFTDIHGLLEPLISVLDDIKKRKITEIYSLGDAIGVGPNSKEVLDLLDKYNVKCINGNNEDYCVLGIEPFIMYFKQEKIDSQSWTMSKLTKEQVEKLKNNKHSYDLIIGGKKVGLCHFASDVRFDYRENSVSKYQRLIKENYEKPQEQFYYTNSEEQKKLIKENSKVKSKENGGYISALKEPLFEGKTIDYYDEIIQGHAHFKLYTEDENVKIRTVKGLGIAFNGISTNLAYYIIIKEKENGFDIEEVYIPYDREKEMKVIDKCDIPNKQLLQKYISEC